VEFGFHGILLVDQRRFLFKAAPTAVAAAAVSARLIPSGGAPETLGYQLPYAPRDLYRNVIREVNAGCSKADSHIPKVRSVENIGARA
jgi:hypothetical protein